MEEPPFLFAMQRQVGSVPIQHDLGERILASLDEHIYRQFIHAFL